MFSNKNENSSVIQPSITIFVFYIYPPTKRRLINKIHSIFFSNKYLQDINGTWTHFGLPLIYFLFLKCQKSRSEQINFCKMQRHSVGVPRNLCQLGQNKEIEKLNNCAKDLLINVTLAYWTPILLLLTKELCVLNLFYYPPFSLQIQKKIVSDCVLLFIYDQRYIHSRKSFKFQNH